LLSSGRSAAEQDDGDDVATDDPARGVQTALRALTILETFTADSPVLTLTEISDAVQLSSPTVHRLLKALRSRDLVYFDPATRSYSLGHGVMRMARVVMERDDLTRIAHPGLERLRAETGETVSLQRLTGDLRVPIVELTSQHVIRMASGVGTAYPIVRGAAGKAMLAFLPQRDQDRLVVTSTEPDRLAKELETIRQYGYAESFSEVVGGAAGLAAPILDAIGAVSGSINITGPRDRFTPERMHAATPALLEVTDAITRQLGGTVSAERKAPSRRRSGK
jgi:DNA-binding IclR family transcriptional regulator